MPNSSRCIKVAVIGLLLFCCGTALLFSASSLSSHRLPPEMVSPGAIGNYQDGDQLHAYSVIAITILGAGAALTVISLGAWIFSPASPENRSWVDSR